MSVNAPTVYRIMVMAWYRTQRQGRFEPAEVQYRSVALEILTGLGNLIWPSLFILDSIIPDGLARPLT
nr:hypothetical protein BaRGS_024211 [Batillaria attramentaria]